MSTLAFLVPFYALAQQAEPPVFAQDNPPLWLEAPISVDTPDLRALHHFPQPPLHGLAEELIHQPELVNAEQALKDIVLPPLAPLSVDLAHPVLEIKSLAGAAFTQTVKAALENLTGLNSLDKAALTDAYQAREYQPLFVEATTIGERAKAINQRLEEAQLDGLEPFYHVPLPENDSEEGRAAFDVALAKSSILFARHASGGRLEGNRLSGLTSVAPEAILAEITLKTLMDSHDVGAALDSFNPPHEGFKRLKVKLGELLKDELNEKKQSRQIAALLANMERWRWLPRALGQTHIWVNIPEYMAHIHDSGAIVHQTRVVVGKPDSQTPIFSHEMETVVVNPSWTVPPSIMSKEVLVAARKDPGYFARRGYQVIKGGKVVDPYSINWTSPGSVGVRQPPGERNALGKLKFLFPNRHAVYLHDTPSRALFSNEYRAYSHGCVRVQQPSVLAEKLLGLANPDEHWSKSRIESLYGKAERSIKMKRKLPIHLVYFTIEVDDQGQLIQRNDIYGHDAKMIAALRAGNAKLAQARAILP